MKKSSSYCRFFSYIYIIPHYKANGTYVDDTPLEKFADIQSPLTNYIKILKKLTPEQAYELKSKLQ